MDGLAVVGDLEGGARGVMDLPEDDGVDIDRHRVPGQRLFGIDLGGPNAVIDPGRDRVDHRDDHEDARAADRLELAQAQHHRLLPLLGDLDRVGEQNGERHHHDGQGRLMGHGEQGGRDEDEHDEDGDADRVHVNLPGGGQEP